MQPARFILSGSQMSEGFAAAECFPAHTDFFSGLPAAGGILPDILADHRGKLDTSARLIFETIARPVVSLRLLGFVDGSDIAMESRILGGNDGAYIALSRPDPDHWDIALLGDRELALAFVDTLTGASRSADLGRDFSIALSMAQLAIIAAVAQLVRIGELQARIKGIADSLQLLGAPLPLQRIEAMIRAEKRRPDPGSPFSRMAMMCEGRLFDVLEGDVLERGLDQLIVDGLADADGALIADGLALVALLKSRETMLLLQSAQREANRVTSEALVMMHGAASLLTGAWRFDAAGRPDRLVLSAMRGAQLLELIDSIMGPLVLLPGQEVREHGGGFCSRCGTLYEESPKFCRECGAPL